MSSQVEYARQGIITEEMKTVAQVEHVTEEYIRQMIEEGKIIIPNNTNRKHRISGIGKGLRTKVNASVGTSTDIINLDMEIEKAIVAQEYGADFLMDLSTGGDLKKIRQEILKSVDLAVGTVPLYEAFSESIKRWKSPVAMPESLLFDIIEEQCEQGVSFMAIHCGINKLTVERLNKQGYRYGGLVSRGGAFMVAWMIHNQKENPLYEKFDKVVDILKKYDVVLSLGNGIRAGSVHDSSDRAQVQELILNCELADIGNKMGCQMMVEGPGHIPIDEIQQNVQLQKKMSNEAPYYMLGPVTTDIAPGLDHIVAAIGAAQSSAYGADFICYLTPAEHLGLPFPEDVKTGVMAARIAAHVGDMAKYGRKQRDKLMSMARRDLDWEKQFEFALYPEIAKRIRNERKPAHDNLCTMCGDFCALNIVNKYFQEALEKGEKRSDFSMAKEAMCEL